MTLPSVPPPRVEGPIRITEQIGTVMQPVFSAPPADDEPRFTLRDVLRVLFRHRWLVLMTAFMVTASVAFGTLAVPFYYTASARLLLRPEVDGTPSYFSGVGVEDRQQLVDPIGRRMETEMALIETEPLASGVVKDLKLTYGQVYTPPLVVIAEPVLRLVDWIAPKLGFPLGDRKGFRKTVEHFRRGILVVPVAGKSAEATPTMVEVRLRAPSAAVAQEALALLLERYVEFQTTLSRQSGQAALDMIRGEVADAQKDVSDSENRLRLFMAGSGYTGPAVGDETRARAGPGAPATPPGDDRNLVQLKTQLLARETQLAEARQTYTANAEPVQRLERLVAALKDRLAKEAKANADDQAKYFAATRALRVAEARLTELQAREAQIAFSVRVIAGSGSDRVVVDPPLLPESNDWRIRAVVIVMGALLGLVLALAFAGVAESLDDTIASKRAAWRALGLAVVGTVPDAADANARAAHVQRLAERVLEWVSFPVPGRINRGRVIAVTSACDGEGKTTVALELARAIGRTGAGSTLLIDGQLADPQISDKFGLLEVPGLSDALHDGDGLDGRVHQATQFSVLSAGTRRVPALLLVLGGLTRVLAEASQRHAFVIVDAGPVGPGFATRIADQADAVLFVVAAERTSRAVILDALAPLPPQMRQRVKVVLNRAHFAIPRFVYDRV